MIIQLSLPDMKNLIQRINNVEARINQLVMYKENNITCHFFINKNIGNK
jgi:hypothetical protein